MHEIVELQKRKYNNIILIYRLDLNKKLPAVLHFISSRFMISSFGCSSSVSVAVALCSLSLFVINWYW